MKKINPWNCSLNCTMCLGSFKWNFLTFHRNWRLSSKLQKHGIPCEFNLRKKHKRINHLLSLNRACIQYFQKRYALNNLYHNYFAKMWVFRHLTWAFSRYSNLFQKFCFKLLIFFTYLFHTCLDFMMIANNNLLPHRNFMYVCSYFEVEFIHPLPVSYL